MQVISGGNLFWTPHAAGAPGHNRLGPVSMRGRSRRLAEQGAVSTNRLDAVSIPAIVGRIALAPEVQAYMVSRTKTTTTKWGAAPTPPPKFLPISETERAVLLAVAAGPSSEELETLANVDNLFTNNFPYDVVTTNPVCYYSMRAQNTAYVPARGKATPGLGLGTQALIEYLNPPPKQDLAPLNQSLVPHNEFTSNRFWCPEPGSLGPTIFKERMPRYWNLFTFAGMFGIDVNARFGDVKTAVANGLIMLDVKSSYPFPPPLDMSPDWVWALSPISRYLPDIANVGAKIDPEVFRAWLTMAVLENYDGISDQIVKDQKEKAKKQKRKALIAGIAIAVAGIVVSFLIPGIIAAAITLVKAAVSFYIAAEERAKAARAMSDAEKMFEADAPAFANEIQKAADMVDAAAAQEQADKPLSQEELDAIQQVKDETPIGTGTMIVGGVAATGLIAVLISVLR